MHQVLFARDPKNEQSLDGFAEAVFAVLALAETEERESSNYPPEGRYFIGYGANASVTVCIADDEDFPLFPFWVVLESPRSRRPAEQPVPPNAKALAETLSAAGLEIFIPSQGWGTTDWVPSGQSYGPSSTSTR